MSDLSREDVGRLRELLDCMTAGPYEAAMAEGTPCVARTNVDRSGGRGFLVAEGWSLADCDAVAETLNKAHALLDLAERYLGAAEVTVAECCGHAIVADYEDDEDPAKVRVYALTGKKVRLVPVEGE